MNPLHSHSSIKPGSSTDFSAVIHTNIKAMMRGDEEIADVHHDESIEMQEKFSSVRSGPSKPIGVRLFSLGMIHFHNCDVGTSQLGFHFF